MKRSGFKAPAFGEFKPLLRKTPLQARSILKAGQGIKRKRPKKRAGHDKAIRYACHGQRCWLRIPGLCEIDPTEAAHRNEGKGMGLKTPDEQTVPACRPCHREYDQGKRFTRDEKRSMFNVSYDRWSAYRDGVNSNVAAESV